MIPYRLSHAAVDDLGAIWQYLAEEAGSAVADRLLASIRDHVDRICEMPRGARPRPDLPLKLCRSWPVGKYVVLYRPYKTHIFVYRVIHQSRDLPSVVRKGR